MNIFDVIRITNFKDVERVINTLDIEENIDISFYKENSTASVIIPIAFEEKEYVSIVNLKEKKKLIIFGLLYFHNFQDIRERHLKDKIINYETGFYSLTDNSWSLFKQFIEEEIPSVYNNDLFKYVSGLNIGEITEILLDIPIIEKIDLKFKESQTLKDKIHDILVQLKGFEPNDKEIMEIIQEMPKEIISIGTQWGYNDTVFGDEAYVWIRDNKL